MKEQESTPGLPLIKPSPAAADKIIPLHGRAKQPPPTAAEQTQAPSLWYALHLPQLAELTDKLQQQYLEQLAQLATGVSSSVSFHCCSLVFEVRSSLRYFGGINALHGLLAPRIVKQLQDWNLEPRFRYAASPTVTGSLLLARGDRNLLVHRRDNLRSALGRLSTDVLELNREERRRLYNMGVRRLQDLWRLPTDGLRKRFGSSFVNQLQRALGERPEPQRYYQPPPAFSSSYDLLCEVENVQLLLPVLEEFLAQLVDFLRRRDLSTSRLVVSLIHERQSCTSITMGLREPSRCRQHLLQLLEIHFNNLAVPAPVIALKMQVVRFDAYLGQSGELLHDSGKTSAGSRRLDLFMEQLQARIGEEPVRKIASVAEHCPEYATSQQDPLLAARRAADHPCTDNPRPLWLLPEPQVLKVCNGKLYHHESLRILSGPERIETRWWSGTDVRRDYYVAQEDNGSRLWIYREKTGDRCWFLHGIFA